MVLLAGFLWAYEAFALWDSPWWTAWIVLAYFAAAFVIDGFFRGASFCKYVCPIGQFNFVQSLVSPLEVKVRDPAVCASCRTKDCIRGRDDIPGCELHLFQPRKSGNMDCTFCLDCIHACPHDNVGILAEPPAEGLWHDPLRSGVGRFGQRPDLAALVVVLVFGAFVNAAGMVAPVLEWREQLASLHGAVPAPDDEPVLRLRTDLAAVLWSDGGGALPPVRPARGVKAGGGHSLLLCAGSPRVQHVAGPLRLPFPGELRRGSVPRSSGLPAIVAGPSSGSRLGPRLLPAGRGLASRLEILSLDVGLLLSLYAGYRIALSRSRRASQALKMLAPWAVLIVLLFAAGVWIVLQPMQMRGTLSAAG